MTRRLRKRRAALAPSDGTALVEFDTGRDGAASESAPCDPGRGCDARPQLIVSLDILDRACRDDDLLMLHCILADARRVILRGGSLVLTDADLGEVTCTTEADLLLLEVAYAPESPPPRVDDIRGDGRIVQ